MRNYFIICFSAFLVFSGCASPYQKLERSEKRIADVSEKISFIDEKKVEQAAGMVYATDLALEQAHDSKQVDAAKTFNDRAQILLGNPSAEDSGKLREMVSDLLSDLEKEKSKGQKALNLLDAKILNLEKDRKKLGNELEILQSKLSELNQKNAALADKEKERESQWWNPFYDFSHGLKKAAIWGILILACVLLLPILAAIFPVIAPAVAFIGSGLGSIFGWILKIIPGAVSGAGVVAKGAFNIADSTKTRIVDAIELWQRDQKQAGKTDYKDLMGLIGNAISDEMKDEVLKSKKAAGW